MDISIYKFNIENKNIKLNKKKIKNKKKSKKKNLTSEPHWMLYITPIAALTGIYAFVNNINTIAIAEWIVVASSVLYWSDPRCSWKRIVDMFVVQASLFIHLYYVYLYKDMESLLLYLLAVCSFIVGHLLNSNIAHSFVWWFGCAGNISLINNISQIIYL